MKKSLKKSTEKSLYVIAFVLVMTGLVLFNYFVNNNKSKEDLILVSKGILDYDDYVPVVKTNNTIIRPYYDSGISIVLKYYDVLASEEDQQNSLIQYDGTYIQSNGVAYSKGNPFDVISILDGTVKEVRQDDIVGNIIVIEHSNGYISTYESIDNIAVEAGMPVVQGQVIAKSATSNISKNLDNHLYFELTKDGENVNPEVYYNKTINE